MPMQMSKFGAKTDKILTGIANLVLILTTKYEEPLVIWFKQLMYGRYPDEQLWRINTAYIVLFLAAIPLFLPRFQYKHWVGLFLLVVYPIFAFVMFHGDTAGLELVETPLWGGLFLTLVIAVTGIVASLPIGIVLALGRRYYVCMAIPRPIICGTR